MAKRKRRRAKPKERILRGLSQARVYALAFFLFSMPLFFLPGNTEYGYTKSIYTVVFVSLLVILWGVEALLRRKVEVELSWLFPLLPTLLLISLLSLTGGAPACVVLQSAGLILYFGFLYLLIVNTVREDREVTLLLSALLASGAMAALYGFLQYLEVVRGGPGTGLKGMITTMGNRNYLGGFLAYLFFPAVTLLFRLRRPWTKGLALMGLGFALAMVLFVQQTGVRLGLLAGGAFLALGLGLWLARGGRWLEWVAAAAVALAAVGMVLGWGGILGGLAIAAIGAGLWALGRLLRRFRWTWGPTVLAALLALFLLIPPTTPFSAIERTWERNSGRARTWAWWVGYEMWKAHPALGVGLGAYKIRFLPFKGDFLATPRGAAYDFYIPRAAQAHNEYVQIAAELGATGFMVLLAGIGLVVFFGLRRVAGQEDAEKRLELLLLGAGILTCLVHATVSFPWHLPSSSLAFVTALGLAFSPRYGPVGSLRARLGGAPLKGLAVGLTALSVGVSVVAVRDLIADRYFFSAEEALYRGDTDLAQAYLEQAVALDFCPRIDLYRLGTTYMQLGELEAARGIFYQSLNRFVPESLYVNLAQVETGFGNLAQARHFLEALLFTHPGRANELEARYLLAKIAVGERDYEQAEQDLQELLAIDRNFERAWVRLGDIAQATGRYPEAREHYQQALVVIDRKVKRLEGREPTTSKEYGEIRSQLELLYQVRAVVEQALSQLP